jgi:hypothetical protein
MIKTGITAFLCVLMAASSVYSEENDVLGILGMDPVQSDNYLSVWVPLQDEAALAGVEWYNNDGTVTFPEILVTAGTGDDPGDVDDATVVLHNTIGISMGWSLADWPGTYRSALGGVYVLFRLPYGSVCVSRGAGGGAAFGYTRAELGMPGSMTSDGVEWCGLHSDYGYAVRPITVPADEATVSLVQAEKALAVDRDPGQLTTPSEITLITEMKSPSPNPFNPQTRLKFTLAEAVVVELSVYDLHGGLVKTLAAQKFSVGEHVVIWDGRDNNGRTVSSGAYLARMKAGRFVQTHRLLLVR